MRSMVASPTRKLMPTVTIIIAEDLAAAGQSPGMDRDAAATLAARWDARVLIVPSLADLAPDGPAVARLRQTPGDMIVVSRLYPRAAYWLLRAHGIDGRPGQGGGLSQVLSRENGTLALGRASGGLSQFRAPCEAWSDENGTVPLRTIWCLDRRGCPDAASLVEQIEPVLAAMGVRAATAAESRPVEVVPADEPALPRWYPVIDYGCCTNCLECLNFCLFGVYGLDDAGRIVVELPDACRDGCPACARVCPVGAIIFPAHHDAAIAGGDPSAAPPPAAGDDLDRLVNELDRSDL